MASNHDDTLPYTPGIRLFVTDFLGDGAVVTVADAQSHYLQHVMRCKVGDEIILFNGRDGEWRAGVKALSKRDVTLICRAWTRCQTRPVDLWLLFAPVKRTRLDFIVEKATELGVAVLQPVFTRFTMADRVKGERMEANVREAAEQCGRLELPEVRAPERLDAVLDGWEADRTLIFCDEGGDAVPMIHALEAIGTGPAAILIGPEGGFHRDERARLKALPWVMPVTLGPRILRADTAAIAALSLYQSRHGDWNP